MCKTCTHLHIFNEVIKGRCAYQLTWKMDTFSCVSLEADGEEYERGGDQRSGNHWEENEVQGKNSSSNNRK